MGSIIGREKGDKPFWKQPSLTGEKGAQVRLITGQKKTRKPKPRKKGRPLLRRVQPTLVGFGAEIEEPRRPTLFGFGKPISREIPEKEANAIFQEYELYDHKCYVDGDAIMCELEVRDEVPVDRTEAEALFIKLMEAKADPRVEAIETNMVEGQIIITMRRGES